MAGIIIMLIQTIVVTELVFYHRQYVKVKVKIFLLQAVEALRIAEN
jgi:hypothetical protein